MLGWPVAEDDGHVLSQKVDRLHRGRGEGQGDAGAALDLWGKQTDSVWPHGSAEKPLEMSLNKPNYKFRFPKIRKTFKFYKKRI